MKNPLPIRPWKVFDPQKFTPDQKPEPKAKPVYNLKEATKKKKKVSGEAQVFLEVWQKRKHVSFVSGKPLGNDAQTWFFAHILAKGKYPLFRLKPQNIVLLTQDEHYQFDQCPRSDIENDPLWQPLLKLEKELKEEYSRLTPKK